MSIEWAALIVSAALGVAGIVGTLLLFILRGIKGNQEEIWKWARLETGDIKTTLNTMNDRCHDDIQDLYRWVRHRNREIYIEMISLARACGEVGAPVIKSIEETMRKDDS